MSPQKIAVTFWYSLMMATLRTMTNRVVRRPREVHVSYTIDNDDFAGVRTEERSLLRENNPLMTHEKERQRFS